MDATTGASERKHHISGIGTPPLTAYRPGAMRTGARTPEELDALLEDAFVVRDRRAVTALFESEALLVDAAAGEARGARQIADWATQTWRRGLTYLAAQPRVLQADDTALVLTAKGISVARRHDERGWRYAIALLSLDHATAREKQ
jgi:hypothetical protein